MTMPQNKPGIEIRMATADDASQIAAVLLAAFEEYRAVYTPAAFAATTPTSDQIQRRIHTNEGPVWVALLHGVIVGTVSAVPKGESVYIRSMAVLPSARGQGIGEGLLRTLESFASDYGARRLFLSTTPFLTSAIWLYAHLGFRTTDEDPHDLFGTPLVTMAKPLEPAQ
jgi:N-acetylglutamate synthase-like GNAT family acetyltransferase